MRSEWKRARTSATLGEMKVAAGVQNSSCPCLGCVRMAIPRIANSNCIKRPRSRPMSWTGRLRRHMTAELQLGRAQSVSIVEADILDEMNETDGLIAERAYEIYQSRGDEHGSDQNDLFEVEQGILD